MLLTEALELLEKNGYEVSDNATEKQRERLAKDIREQIVPAMMEILLNGYDLGCLGIKECVQIPVQYGHYNVVVKYLDKVMTKYKGIGMEFDITPDNRIMYLKVERVIPGYTATVVVEQATPEEMPPLQ